jgi:ABC-type transport system involved in multi-copper enzyme maturation permease subunit
VTDVAAPPAPQAPAPAAAARTGRAPLNPVLARELKIRLRGGRAWLLLTVYLLLLGGICFLVYEAESGNTAQNPFDQFGGFAPPSPTEFATVGRSIFEWVVFFMLLLVLFLVPGLTSGAIAGERERQTLVPLQVTLLRPWQIVVGKLGASFAYLALLVLATAPLLSIAYLIGGVTFASVLQGLGIVLFTGLAVTCVTLLASAVFRRVQTATVASYALVLLLALGTFVAWWAFKIIDESRGDDPGNPPAWLLAPNPLFAAADVLAEDDISDLGGGGVSSPFEPLEDVLLQSEHEGFIDGGGFVGGPGVPVDNFGRPIGTDEDGNTIIGFDRFGRPILADDGGWPFWATSVITLYVMAVAAGAVAVRRLRSPTKVER